MSEPNITDLQNEVNTLRSVKDELLAKTHTLKSRITELETERNTFSEAADKSKAALKAVVINKPVRELVEQLNPKVPELLLRELQDDFDFGADEQGNIVVTTKDGKVIAGKDGKPVPFDKFAMSKFLVGDGYAEPTERQKMYAHIVAVSWANGGERHGRNISSVVGGKEVISKAEFGLR